MGLYAAVVSLLLGTSTPPAQNQPPTNLTVVVPTLDSAESSKSGTTINIYNTTNNNQTASSNSQATSDATTTVENNNINQASAIAALGDRADQAKKWLEQYRTRLLLASATGSYATLYWHLAMTYYGIDHSIWGNWKKHLSNEELYEQALNDETKKELSKKLAQDIFNHHINPSDPTNSISPLTDFTQTIKQEIARANRYIFLSQLMLKLRLSYLFPVNNQKTERAKQCRARLKFINSLFVSWAASYNFNKF